MVFAPLADRGYGLSKAFGLLIFGYAVWLMGVTHLVPNGPVAYTLALLGIAAGSGAALRRAGDGSIRDGFADLVELMRRRRGLLLIEEAVLLAAYGGFLLVRRHNP